MDIQPHPTGLHLLIPSAPTLVLGIDERARTLTPHHESLISSVCEVDLPAIHPSHLDSTSQMTAFPWCTQV